MKRILAVVLLLCSIKAAGQGNAVIRQFPGVPSGGCSFIILAINAATGDLYNCASGAWHPSGTTTGTGTVTTFSAGNLAPLFTSSVANASTAPALTFTLSNAAARTVLANNTAGSAAPAYVAPTLTGVLFANQGTTTTLLHGNAAGNQSYAAVDLANDVTGTLAAGSLPTTLTSGTAITNAALTTPSLGVATATSINKMAITAPATSSTLAVANGKTFTASNTITLTGTDGVTANISNVRIRTVTFTFGAPEGSTLTTGLTRYVTVPYACTISAFNLLADAGTFTVKFWKVATGTAIPTVANSISTSGVSLSSGTALHSTTVTDFTTTAVSANDIMAANITALATAKMVQAQLQCDQ